jgi:hypothetical protein
VAGQVRLAVQGQVARVTLPHPGNEATSAEHREGVSAFLEKTPPRF